jgi:hypothetical protein
MEGLAPFKGVIANALVAAVGIPLVMKAKQLTQEQRNAVAGGMATSLVHGLLVQLLTATGNAQAASFLSGQDDSTAARLSAMYGMGADLPRVSIDPMYAPAAGMGEYYAAQAGLGQIQQAAAGMGIFQAAAGMGSPLSTGPGFAYRDGSLGEYFESGVEALGNYTTNPQILEAAAGYGTMGAEYNTNHVQPGGDLDRELSIVEAAAGVGEYFESGVSGLGATDVPRSSTWIPGETNPSLWAGTRAITRTQNATANVTAGMLASPGGSGIFG